MGTYDFVQGSYGARRISSCSYSVNQELRRLVAKPIKTMFENSKISLTI